MNDVLTYQLLPYSDYEGKTVTPSYTCVDCGFETFISDEFTFAPDQFSQVGVHTIEISLNDTFRVSKYNLTVEVTNSPPYFTVSPVNQILPIMSDKTYTLTDFVDDEGNPITITAEEKFANGTI